MSNGQVSFNAKFSWNPSGIAKSGMEKRKKEAHAALDSQLIKDTAPYVPRLTGMLVSSAARSPQVGGVVWSMPYASRLYYGTKMNFTRAYNPQAGPRWLERSKTIWFPKWKEIVKKILTNR